jgi:hypothetical protein
LADKLKDSGSVDMAYVKDRGQPIPDQDGAQRNRLLHLGMVAWAELLRLTRRSDDRLGVLEDLWSLKDPHQALN